MSVSAVSEQKSVTKRFVSFVFYNNKAEYVKNVELKVDSGSEGNLMPLKLFREAIQTVCRDRKMFKRRMQS